MSKDFVITLRVTGDELKKLDAHTETLTRAQLLRILVKHFIGLSEIEQKEFVMRQLFPK